MEAARAEPGELGNQEGAGGGARAHARTCVSPAGGRQARARLAPPRPAPRRAAPRRARGSRTQGFGCGGGCRGSPCAALRCAVRRPPARRLPPLSLGLGAGPRQPPPGPAGAERTRRLPFRSTLWERSVRRGGGSSSGSIMSAGGDFGNPLRKFKLVFLGEQSGECAPPRTAPPRCGPGARRLSAGLPGPHPAQPPVRRPFLPGFLVPHPSSLFLFRVPLREAPHSGNGPLFNLGWKRVGSGRCFPLRLVRVSRKVESGGRTKQAISSQFSLNEEFVRVRELIYSTRGDVKRWPCQ